MKCLVVEPSKSYRQFLSSLLVDAGFDVDEASDAEEGLNLAVLQEYALICVAMHLKDMDGVAFSTRLRADHKSNHVPLLMITSNSSLELSERAMKAGVTDILYKSELDKIDGYLHQFYKERQKCNEVNGRILYVEDSAAVANKIIFFLEKEGKQVSHYTSAEEALDAFRQQEFDIVLTDVLLEGKINGYGLIREIRNSGAGRKNTPILVTTGFDDTARRIELLHAGANDYISKPVEDEELLVRLNNLILNSNLKGKAIRELTSA